jgi:hypothetical protein
MSNRRHNLRRAVRAHHTEQAKQAHLARLGKDLESSCDQTRAAAIAEIHRLWVAAGHEAPAEVQA